MGIVGNCSGRRLPASAPERPFSVTIFAAKNINYSRECFLLCIYWTLKHTFNVISWCPPFLGKFRTLRHPPPCELRPTGGRCFIAQHMVGRARWGSSPEAVSMHHMAARRGCCFPCTGLVRINLVTRVRISLCVPLRRKNLVGLVR